MRVLYVCTANICRSPSAAALLRDAVVAHPELTGIDVQSAGTAAWAGAPGCRLAPALAGRAEAHRSQGLTAELVVGADLILTAERAHRAAVISLETGARSRTFTLRQAGRVADWLGESGMVDAALERAVVDAGTARGPADVGVPPSAGHEWADRFVEGDPRAHVSPMAGACAQRWRWVVAELDAGRGMAPHGVAQATRSRVRGRGRIDPASGTPVGHPDDVPDPHVLGMWLHGLTHEQIRAATDALVRLLVAVAA